jgi:EmrB/QacA subfamily drug resistance transporter
MTTVDNTPVFAVERDTKLRIIIPFVVAIAFLMEQLDSTIIVTAIPDIAKSLDTTPLRMNLAITAYVLMQAMFIPVSGWFADRFGAKRVFAAALFIFTVSSVLCGMATSLPMLIAVRALQGLGGAMMTPVGRLAMIRSFPRSQLMKAMTYMTLPAVIGPLIGPLLGGLLTTYADWRWIFWVNVPFGLIGVLVALRYIDDTRADTRARFDFPGFLMVGFGCLFLQYGIENIGHPAIPVPAIVAVLALGAALLVMFYRYARTAREPAVDLTLFRSRTFRVGTLYGGICRIGLNGVPFLLPLMLQVGFGMSPVSAGLITSASALSVLANRPFLPYLLRRFGFRSLLNFSAIAGALLIAGFAFLDPATPHWFLMVYAFLFGMTRSVQFLGSNMLSYSETPAEKLSRATSLFGVLQQLSVSFGVSVAAMLLGLFMLDGAGLTAETFRTVFLISAVLPLLGLPGYFSLRREDGAAVSGYKPREIDVA